MNGNSLFVDTNILLYILSGDNILKEQLNNKSLYISFITELEILSFSEITPQQQSQIKKFLTNFIIIPYQEVLKDFIVNIRRSHKMKIPDAIIAASALYYDLPLITADKSFSKLDVLNCYLYKP